MRRFFIAIGAVFLLFGLVALLRGGLTIIFTSTPRPVPLGWGILIVSFALAASTAKFWSTYLPGLIGSVIINSAYLVSFGHSYGQPDRPVRRSLAWIVLGFFVVLGVMSVKLERRMRKLDFDFADRVCFALLVLFVSVMMVFCLEALGVAGGIGIVSTLGTLLIRHRRPRRSRRRKEPVDQAA